MTVRNAQLKTEGKILKMAIPMDVLVDLANIRTLIQVLDTAPGFRCLVELDQIRGIYILTLLPEELPPEIKVSRVSRFYPLGRTDTIEQLIHAIKNSDSKPRIQVIPQMTEMAGVEHRIELLWPPGEGESYDVFRLGSHGYSQYAVGLDPTFDNPMKKPIQPVGISLVTDDSYPIQDIKCRFEYETLSPLEGMNRISESYSKTFGSSPSEDIAQHMARIVAQTKEDLFIWWGAHREKIHVALETYGEFAADEPPSEEQLDKETQEMMSRSNLKAYDEELTKESTPFMDKRLLINPNNKIDKKRLLEFVANNQGYIISVEKITNRDIREARFDTTQERPERIEVIDVSSFNSTDDEDVEDMLNEVRQADAAFRIQLIDTSSSSPRFQLLTLNTGYENRKSTTWTFKEGQYVKTSKNHVLAPRTTIRQSSPETICAKPEPASDLLIEVLRTVPEYLPYGMAARIHACLGWAPPGDSHGGDISHDPADRQDLVRKGLVEWDNKTQMYVRKDQTKDEWKQEASDIMAQILTLGSKPDRDKWVALADRMIRLLN